MTTTPTPRQWDLLRDIAHRDVLHVCAHRTVTGQAVIVETAVGVSYPVTITPLVTAGLLDLGPLTDIEGRTRDSYHQRARTIRLTDLGRQTVAAAGGAR